MNCALSGFVHGETFAASRCNSLAPLMLTCFGTIWFFIATTYSDFFSLALDAKFILSTQTSAEYVSSLLWLLRRYAAFFDLGFLPRACFVCFSSSHWPCWFQISEASSFWSIIIQIRALHGLRGIVSFRAHGAPGSQVPVRLLRPLHFIV